jgi:hypothetical protein
MKTIDFIAESEVNRKIGVVSKASKALNAIWQRKERKAQEAALGALGKILDNRFVLFRNVSLPNQSLVIPAVLVGPAGIWAINQTAAKGSLRVNGDSWEEKGSKGEGFKPGKVNLLTQTLQMASGVDKYLAEKAIQVPKVEAVLFFLDPGAHIESMRPAVRLVMVDVVNRFGVSLLQSSIILSNESIKQVVAVMMSAIPGYDQPPAIHDKYSLRETRVKKKRAPILNPELTNELARAGEDEPEIIKKVSKQATFTTRQWILLGVLLVVTLLILIVLVLTVLVSA